MYSFISFFRLIRIFPQKTFIKLRPKLYLFHLLNLFRGRQIYLTSLSISYPNRTPLSLHWY
ncbi:hypothetical protein BpHYR1_004906 [Brachionus plicatilis]|uniref:Uncharacterized protein n=1 Tax=Brachionus plicatilis TaxID=10195 RepID=A0A3M7RR56_BRAPC|nr:hypothetical protein BpHYR1_004906 [Brachionus plicatilis]